MSVGRVMCLEVKGSPPEGKPEAAHSCGNGGGGCFNPNHLYWASKAENYRDRVTHGVSQRGPRHGMAKLTEGDVREIRNLCAGGVLQRAVAARFNIARPTVSTIVQRRNWQWVD